MSRRMVTLLSAVSLHASSVSGNPSVGCSIACVGQVEAWDSPFHMFVKAVCEHYVNAACYVSCLCTSLPSHIWNSLPPLQYFLTSLELCNALQDNTGYLRLLKLNWKECPWPITVAGCLGSAGDQSCCCVLVSGVG